MSQLPEGWTFGFSVSPKPPTDQLTKNITSGQCIGSVQETVDSNDDYSSDSSVYLHNILQLGT